MLALQIMVGRGISLHLIRRKLRYSSIRAGLDALSLSGIADLITANFSGAVVFTLHHVRPELGEALQPNEILSVTPDFLAAAIETSREAGLVPVHLHELPELLARTNQKCRYVAFSLDDGYRNNLQFAAPVFERFQVPFTVFPTVGFVKRSNTIWWETCQAIVQSVASFSFDFGRGLETMPTTTLDERHGAFRRFAVYVNQHDEDEAVALIDELARRRNIDPVSIVSELVLDGRELSELSQNPLVEIGAHSVSHVNLHRVSDERLQHEIAGSISAIERYCGYRPKCFAYPYGWGTAYGAREEEALARAGFVAAFTTRPAVLRSGSLKNPMALSRVSLNGYFQKKRYVKSLIAGLALK